MFRHSRGAILRSLAISLTLVLAVLAVPAKPAATSTTPLPASHLTSATTASAGYLLAGADGSVYGFGAQTYGSTYTDGLTGLGGAHPLAAPIVGMAATPNGGGYWMVGKDGGVFNFGDAANYGSTYTYGITGLGGAHPLNAPIVGMAATPNGGGYWLVAADGGVFDFGNAHFYGSTYTYGITGLGGAHPLNAPIVGIVPTPNGGGYWLIAADGGVFDFGDAGFYGSTYTYGITGLGGAHPLNAPIVGMAATPNGGGYWMVAADGGVFDFGDAGFYGSTYSDGITGLGGAHPLNKPIVGMTVAPGGGGYWLVAADGGVFNFGSAPFLNSLGSQQIPAPIVAMVMVPEEHGYDVSNYNCQDLPNSPQGLMFVETNGYPFSFDYTPPNGVGCGTASNGISQGLMAALEIAGNATQPFLFLGDNPNASNTNPAVTNLVPSGCASTPDDVGLTATGTTLPGWNTSTCQYDEPNASGDFATAPVTTSGCQLYVAAGHSCDTPGPNFNFGWQQAIFGYDTATVNANAAGLPNIVHNTWWLDTETSGSWTSNPRGNYDAILGAIAALESLGAANVGVYSTNYQWSQITDGGMLPSGTSLWVPDPGATPASVCQGAAGSSWSAFGGGVIRYVQYGTTSQFGGAIDEDASC
ncbi:hypothetical protein [Ferrimicrobium sp.]|uniref:hypothetical protein n=1 Tax=Ferrimicrobium sp. TaxID=2926050 RepID=UPI00260F29F1|nr:hypothetical protein [Ferrimicrobium sp.]